jgi:hypothetical protein
MTVVAPLYTTCWGMLKQPDNQELASHDSSKEAPAKATHDPAYGGCRL